MGESIANYLSDMELIFLIYRKLCIAILKKTNNPIKMGRESEQKLLREDIKIANKIMERYSIPLVIQEMQIKETINYHFTWTCMALLKTQRGRECGEI